jgi:deoxyribose-phosphate aldolase
MIEAMSSIALDAARLSGFIEHTLLAPGAGAGQIERLCAEARANHFFAVCVNGSWVPHARRMLEGTAVRVVSVVGFPLGAVSRGVKRFETETLVGDGAQEIDCVPNIGRLKQGDDRYVLCEIGEVVKAAAGRPVKVILETCLLGNEEKIRACRLAVDGGARFVKTSTGFGAGGATVADVALMRNTVGPDFGIKASGGIRDAKTALAMIEAGSTRLGTSAGVAIIRALAL